MAETGGEARSSRLLFVATICAGSFLLFLVQPMIARMALPRLGGAPAVWNSAMLVYQALLLAGYGYAHWLGQRSGRQQRIIHLLAFVAAALMLPIGLMAGDLPRNANPVLWVPWLLLGSIGPLFLVVSAQAPLMQRWYSLSGGTNPYPLYAASNLGSFAGLISYPLLVEPMMPVAQQSLLWTIGYGLLLILVFLCSRHLGNQAAETAQHDADAASPTPDARHIGKWILLSAIPSGLMLSTSLHLTTDIVAMPLLWVLPLGLYLLSFSVAFAEGGHVANAIAPLAPLLLLLAACGAFVDTTSFALVYAGLTLVNLFFVSVALHKAMYDSRPPEAHLTRFYLVMSLGGVIGGIFCALLAPLLFNWAFEYPILLLAAGVMILREPLFQWTHKLWSNPETRLRNILLLSVVAAGLSLVGFIDPGGLKATQWDQLTVVFLIAIAVIAIGNRTMFGLGMLAIMLCLGGWERLELAGQPGRMTRSYFGIYTIRDHGTNSRSLAHGTTMHGIQNLQPGKQTIPTSYYAPQSGVGLAAAATPRLFGDHARIGVVGLGSGTMACYARAGQDWRFFEIDPAIETIARNPANFSFIERCLPAAKVLIGDARLVLAEQPAGSADLLIIDAFSSDSVPMHLLTREAFAVYGRYLQPDGLLMVHISNRYLDLAPVVSAAASRGWIAKRRFYQPDRAGEALNFSPSDWIAMSRSAKTIDALVNMRAKDDWGPLERHPQSAGWTDNYASILPIIRWRQK